jgi:hypothetical protein
MISRVAVLAVLGGVAWAGEASQPAAPATEGNEGVIDPKADAVLHRMSDYMSGLKTFKVDTTTVDEKVATDGQKVQEIQESKVMVQRPGEMRVERVSPRGHTTFIDDGKKFALYNKERGIYATSPAPARLDAAIDQARDKLRVDAPGGDLLVPDPYRDLVDGTVTGRYIGLEPVGNVMAHHLAFTKKDVDWQIWIQDGPQAVPLRYVITSKDVPSQPQFTLMMHNWEPNAPLLENSFTPSPAAGARRVDFTEFGKYQQQPVPSQQPQPMPSQPQH